MRNPQQRCRVPALSEMMERFHRYHDGLMIVFVVPWVVASVAFVVVTSFFRTYYARWMAILSPILVPITMPLGAALPAPFGGYVRPILGTTIWTLFFLVATRVTWNMDSAAQKPQR